MAETSFAFLCLNPMLDAINYYKYHDLKEALMFDTFFSTMSRFNS